MQVSSSRSLLCVQSLRPLHQIARRYQSTSSGTPISPPQSTSSSLVTAPRKPRKWQHPGGITSPELALESSRKRTKAEKYFARVAREDLPPSRMSKRIGYASWIICGGLTFYMVLYANFGERDHVFTPIRREWKSFTTRMSTLSPEERAIMNASNRPINDGKSA